MDKLNYLGFAVLELSKLHMYETYYDKLQPYFGQENIQLHFIDTDAFVISVNTEDNIIDLKKLGDIFNFSNLEENHEFFGNKNKNVIGKIKIEAPKNICIDELICLRRKMYSFKCGADCENKLKGVSKSQSKHIIFEDYEKCSNEENYQRKVINLYYVQLMVKSIFKKVK